MAEEYDVHSGATARGSRLIYTVDATAADAFGAVDAADDIDTVNIVNGVSPEH